MVNYDRRIPTANRDAIELFIDEQQQYNESNPSAWDDDQTDANDDGRRIDFRSTRPNRMGRIFSLFSTAAYIHTAYYNDYYYIIERRRDRRVEVVMYQRQVDHWKQRNFDEWVNRSVAANMDWYRVHPDLPRHELIPFIPFLDEYNFRHGACDQYSVYTVYNRLRGGVIARWSYLELQEIWRRDFDAYLLPEHKRGHAWDFARWIMGLEFITVVDRDPNYRNAINTDRYLLEVSPCGPRVRSNGASSTSTSSVDSELGILMPQRDSPDLGRIQGRNRPNGRRRRGQRSRNARARQPGQQMRWAEDLRTPEQSEYETDYGAIDNDLPADYYHDNGYDS